VRRADRVPLRGDERIFETIEPDVELGALNNPGRLFPFAVTVAFDDRHGRIDHRIY